ncbi:hypothetical protein [Sphingomonas aerolata]|uniref:hypothetical protein n=1 Tax=Sphingomonas aerolata TaxID=185951 RepID=UPI002FE216BC
MAGSAGRDAQLLLAMLLDVGLLTVQLYLSGGATNPFIALYLLQVVLGAVLLDRWSSWAIVGVTGGCFALLTIRYRPLALPTDYAGEYFALCTVGSLLNFLLVATLLVLFMTRITGNLRARDEHLADLRQQAAEEDHIVRMGLLASGAAHELGTPLASLAVILNDWSGCPRSRPMRGCSRRSARCRPRSSGARRSSPTSCSRQARRAARRPRSCRCMSSSTRSSRTGARCTPVSSSTIPAGSATIR